METDTHEGSGTLGAGRSRIPRGKSAPGVPTTFQMLVHAGDLQKFQVARDDGGKLRCCVWDRGMTSGTKFKEGQETEFSPRTYAVMIANWKARGEPLSLCYNHQSAYAKDNGQPAPALAFYDAVAVVEGGQIVQFEKLGRSTATPPDVAQLAEQCRQLLATDENPNPSPDGCWWYRSEHTELGEEMLGGFKFLSPMFDPNGYDEQGKEIGYTIYDLAATNTAFQAGCMINFERRVLMANWDDLRVGDSVTATNTSSGADESAKIVEKKKDALQVRVRFGDGHEEDKHFTKVQKLESTGARTLAVFKPGDRVSWERDPEGWGSKGLVRDTMPNGDVIVQLDDGRRVEVPPSDLSKLERFTAHGTLARKFAFDPSPIAQMIRSAGYAGFADDFTNRPDQRDRVVAAVISALKTEGKQQAADRLDTEWQHAGLGAGMDRTTGALARTFAGRPGSAARKFAQTNFDSASGARARKFAQPKRKRPVIMVSTTCPFCGRDQEIDSSGRLKSHEYPTGGSCRGSGQKADDASGISTGFLEKKDRTPGSMARKFAKATYQKGDLAPGSMAYDFGTSVWTCPVCRYGIDVWDGYNFPTHKNPQTGQTCMGSGMKPSDSYFNPPPSAEMRTEAGHYEGISMGKPGALARGMVSVMNIRRGDVRVGSKVIDRSGREIGVGRVVDDNSDGIEIVWDDPIREEEGIEKGFWTTRGGGSWGQLAQNPSLQVVYDRTPGAMARTFAQTFSMNGGWIVTHNGSVAGLGPRFIFNTQQEAEDFARSKFGNWLERDDVNVAPTIYSPGDEHMLGPR